MDTLKQDATYRQRFEAMVAELQASPWINILEVTIREPASESDLRAAEEIAGPLPAEMVSFYREMNGFTLEWEVSDEGIKQVENAAEGAINLLPVSGQGGVFSDWEGTTYFDDMEEGDIFQEVLPFDLFMPEACAALYPVKAAEATVHFHVLGEELHPTGYSFAEYLELLLQSRGYTDWTCTLCQEEKDSAYDFFEDMPKLFEGFSKRPFRPNTRKRSFEPGARKRAARKRAAKKKRSARARELTNGFQLIRSFEFTSPKKHRGWGNPVYKAQTAFLKELGLVGEASRLSLCDFGLHEAEGQAPRSKEQFEVVVRLTGLDEDDEYYFDVKLVKRGEERAFLAGKQAVETSVEAHDSRVSDSRTSARMPRRTIVS